MIPREITAEHLLQAIALLDEQGIPSAHQGTKFAVLHNGKFYPPKLLISKAALFAVGEEHSVKKFSGGRDTNSFLQKRGFVVVELTKE